MTENREELSSPVQRGFATVRKMMSIGLIESTFVRSPLFRPKRNKAASLRWRLSDKNKLQNRPG